MNVKQKLHKCVVVAYLPADENGPSLYKVEFEADRDLHDLELAELEIGVEKLKHFEKLAAIESRHSRAAASEDEDEGEGEGEGEE